jgi:membrane protein
MQVDRERLVRGLTFWLRPDFVLRCLRRFQAVEGFDRAIALSSLCFSAVIPLGIVTSGIVSDHDIGSRLVDRFELEGKGATAVSDLFNANDELASGFSLFSAFLLLVAILSFSRAVQRLFERTWELPPLSVRNTKNGLIWVVGLVVYTAVAGVFRTELDDGLVEVVSAGFLLALGLAFVLWSGVLLTDGRVSRRELLPAAILIVALGGILGIAGDIYVPRLFNSYASRYGAVGAVFALISWLFVLMVALVSATAVGREVSSELDSIRRGERPSRAQIDEEWGRVRAMVGEWRARRNRKSAGG